MKITVKTLKGELIPVEVNPDSSILTIKQKIQSEKDIKIEDQKIVYKGKATVNTDILENLGVKNDDFFVLMISVKKTTSKAKVEQKQESVQEKKQQKKTIQIPKVPPTLEKSQENITAQQAKITQLMTMGFDRQKCIAALQAAFGNQDRAVEYLLNGIPSQLNFAEAEQDQNVQNIFRALVNNPNFQSFRNLLRSDPTSLQPVLAQIASTSMPLYNLIAQNPQTFQRIVLEDEQDDEQYDEEGQQANDVIHLSPQDQAAISRLMGLGFTKLDVAQAYFACDKNEEMSANLLFDRQANGDLGFLEEGQPNDNSDGDDDNLFN